MIQEAIAPSRFVGIDIGTTALDCPADKPVDITRHPGRGKLLLLNAYGQTDTGEIFTLAPSYESIQNAHAGGIGNAVNAIAPVLEATRLETAGIRKSEMAALGQFAHTVWGIVAKIGNDDAGRRWLMEIDPRIDTSSVSIHPTIHSSGLSYILIQENETATEETPAGERVIFFSAGAGGTLELNDEDVDQVISKNPFNAHISYPGLFPDGIDQTNGRELAGFINQMHNRGCPCVSMDIHSKTELKYIEPALPVIDMFNSNMEDGARIFLEKDVRENIPNEDRLHLYQEIRDTVITKYFTQDGTTRRCRMFTFTDKNGVYLIFQNQNGQIQSDYVVNACASIPAVNKTGAGDVRFAIQRLYVAVSKPQEWIHGEFDWEDAKLAVNVGQIATTLHLQGKNPYGLEGISLQVLKRAVETGQRYLHISDLKQTLNPSS